MDQLTGPDRGAGGTPGGIGRFLLGVAMVIVGAYLLLNAIRVVHGFGFGRGLYSIGGFGITSGMILIPFIIGVVIIFYDRDKWYGWLLAVGSLLALIVGAIASIQFSFQGMSAFDIIVVLVLLFGGVGLVLSSLQDLNKSMNQQGRSRAALSATKSLSPTDLGTFQLARVRRMTLPRVWFEREPVRSYRERVAAEVVALGPSTVSPDDPFADLLRAQGIVAGSLHYGGAVMDLAPDLLVIARTGIGVDTVDIHAATQRSIAVCNAPAAPTVSTAEHTVLLMLASAKRLERAQTGLRQGSQDLYGGHHGIELAGKRLALLGYGRIARRVARVAAALDMAVVVYDPFVDDASVQVERAGTIEEVVADADVISVHVPLTEDTAGMFGDEFFGWCKRGTVFINTARGGLVDQEALLRALDDGRVGAAGLDVTDPEPLAPEHPLLHRDDVVVTPHVATATDLGRLKNFEGAYLQVLDVLGDAGRLTS